MKIPVLLSFFLTAKDPDNDFIDINYEGTLPNGANFRNKGFGITKKPGISTARFNWTPDYTQSGQYSLVFTANDGTLTTKMNTLIEVIDKQKLAKLTVATYKPYFVHWFPLSGVTIQIQGATTKTSQTKSNGYAYFEDLVPDTYTVTASISGYRTQINSVTLKELESKTLQFFFTPLTQNQGYLEGKVIESGSNKPLKGVTIYADKLKNLKAVTDSNGYYKVALSEGSYKVEAFAFSYKAQTQTVSIQRNKTTTLNFTLIYDPNANVGVSMPIGGTGKENIDTPIDLSRCRSWDIDKQIQ